MYEFLALFCVKFANRQFDKCRDVRNTKVEGARGKNLDEKWLLIRFEQSSSRDNHYCDSPFDKYCDYVPRTEPQKCK